MPWLTQLLKRDVETVSGVKLGRVSDLFAVAARFPRVNAIAVTLNRSGREHFGEASRQIVLEWSCLDQVAGKLKVSEPYTTYTETGGELRLRADVLDKQIVDIDGARIIRVNDLLLSETGRGPTVVAADVGIKGILRGLGIEGIGDRVAHLLGYTISDRLIAWNFVTPLSGDPDRVQLTVPGRLLRELRPSELADILEQLDPDLRLKTINLMSEASLAEMLPEADPQVSAQTLEQMSDERARKVVELMAPDEAADLLGSLGYAKSERLMGLMGVKQAGVLRELLGHPPESAGGRMTPSFVALPETVTAKEAIAHIRTEAASVETIHYAYVLNPGGHLQGVISIRGLLRAEADLPVRDVMQTNLVTVNVADDQEEVARTMARYNLLAIPVLDEYGVMRGVVTVDDIVDVLEREASEDLGQVAGVYLGQGAGVTSGRLAGFGVSILGGAIAALFLENQAPLLATSIAVAWLLPVYMRITQDLGTWSLARSFSTASLSSGARLDALGQELMATLTTAGVSGLLITGFGAWWTGSFSAGLLLGVGIFVGSLAASIVGLGLPNAAKAVGLNFLLSRGRVLTVAVGLTSIVVYTWALNAVAGRF